ncbi:PQ loop repeat family protein [Dirofilaria immitis]|nr:PQ loop repeat family protein [Dirofilaria immitis]
MGKSNKTRERGSGKYFGGGFSFVWNLNENNQLNKYGWEEGQAECFMAAPYEREPTVLMIGGNAIYIADELLNGSSLPSNTFRNPELAKGGTFKINDMETMRKYRVKMVNSFRNLKGWFRDNEGFNSFKIGQLLHFIFPNRCYELMLLEYDFLHQECISMVISRLLGLGLTFGSVFIFVPQILKIQFAQSGEGISLLSQLLGMFASFAITAYSYSKEYVFSQWGDSFFVTIQMIIIIIQILWFSSRQAHAAVFLAFCWTVSCAVMGKYIPVDILALVQAITIPIITVAKAITGLKTKYGISVVGVEHGAVVGRIKVHSSKMLQSRSVMLIISQIPAVFSTVDLSSIDIRVKPEEAALKSEENDGTEASEGYDINSLR